ncbi:unnamed protein product, partial [Iphiclides podalirius]
MDDLIASILDFIRFRQINIAIAAILSIVYVAYQYRSKLFKVTYDLDEDSNGDNPTRLSRSCSRSRSRPHSVSSYRGHRAEEKVPRRGRRLQRRCPSCRNEDDEVYDNVPFVLKHFFRDVKNIPGSDSIVSAVCKKCSKRINGGLNSTSTFLSHLTAKGHGDLLSEYMKLKPQSPVAKETVEDDEGPILNLLKCLITNDYKQNTMLTNFQLINILHKEFCIDVKNIHELEVEIYLNVVKKYLKDWPEWELFEQAVSDIKTMEDDDDDAMRILLQEKYRSLKEYLSSKLDLAQIFAQEVISKVPDGEKTSSNERGVVMEVKATRQQLNNLILRRPIGNNAIFNLYEPDVEIRQPNELSLQSILNSCGISVEIRMRDSQNETFILKYENQHQTSHNLVNRKLKIPHQFKELNQEWQIKCKKMKKAVELPKAKVLDLLESGISNTEKEEWKHLLICMYQILNVLMGDMPLEIYSPAMYRKYLSRYSFVRYLYREPEDEEAPAEGKYDIQLEEVISPMCLIDLNHLPKAESEDYFKVRCNSCNLVATGPRLVTELQEHFVNRHIAEPDWCCASCKQSVAAAKLASSNWQHRCPDGDKAKTKLHKS